MHTKRPSYGQALQGYLFLPCPHQPRRRITTSHAIAAAAVVADAAATVHLTKHRSAALAEHTPKPTPHHAAPAVSVCDCHTRRVCGAIEINQRRLCVLVAFLVAFLC